MNSNDIFSEIISGLRSIEGHSLPYISGRNEILLVRVNTEQQRVEVSRNDEPTSIPFAHFQKIAEHLARESAVKVDVVFTGGGNTRSIVETLVAQMPKVAYIPANWKGVRGPKQLKWYPQDLHPIGQPICIDDIPVQLQTLVLQPQASAILHKPFMLLAGISGTGKTRFVRTQSEFSRPDRSNYCLIPVRPDWHEPSDLLGYVSRISGTPKYIVTDVLQFLVKAWKDAWSGVETNDYSQIAPFWLCLDEMNLAPVEQYFADYLSVLETRKWDEVGYSCEPLLKFEQLGTELQMLGTLRADLDLSGESHEAIWQYFVDNRGIPLPPNLIVAGTVNMDETTHGFSRKVLDRAVTLDFGEFFPNDFDAFLEPNHQVVSLTFPTQASAHGIRWDQLASELNAVDDSIQMLKAINEQVLGKTPFELSYRALNELLLAVAFQNPRDRSTLQAVWDDFLMTKVLPRIEGDADKLRNHNGRTTVSDRFSTVLDGLEDILPQFLGDIWPDGTTRPDLLRRASDGGALGVVCRSKRKLAWMKQKLQSNGFTTYWP